MPLEFRRNPVTPEQWEFYDAESGTVLIQLGTGTTVNFVANAIEAAAIPDGSVTDAKLATTNLLGGASGTVGRLRIYPTTASKGYLQIDVADQTGDTALIVRGAAHGQATVVTIPDGGQSTASFVLTEGTQTINGVKTIPALATTNLDAGASGTAGSIDIFPSTASKGKIALAAADSAGDTTTTITNASQAGARTYTIPDAGASASFVMTEGAQTINGNKTYGGNQIRTSYKKTELAVGAKVGGTAGWVVKAADNVYYCTLPASQTGSKLIIPVMGLHVGDTITGFGLIGQIESAGGAVTVDCDLRVVTAVAADVTDTSVGTMTQIAVSADTAIDAAQDKGSLASVVGSGTVYYLVVTATTAASTDVVMVGYSITVTTA